LLQGKAAELAPIQTGKPQELANSSFRLPAGQATAVGVAVGVGDGPMVGVAVGGAGVMLGAAVGGFGTGARLMLELELSPLQPAAATSRRPSSELKTQAGILTPAQ